MAKVSLQAQAMAVELACMGKIALRRTIEPLVAKGRRPASDLEMLDRMIPELRAAVQTLKWLLLNEEAIKSAVGREGVT